MTRSILLLVLSLFVCSNCNNNQSIPLSEEKMVEIIRDLHIAEAAMQNLVGITKDSLGQIYYQQIFDLHEVNEVDFDTSIQRLRRDPTRLNQIYDKVLLSLDQIPDSLLYNK